MRVLIRFFFETLETLFMSGIGGCLLVLILTFLEDVKTLFM